MTFDPERLLQNDSLLGAYVFQAMDGAGYEVATVVAKMTWRVDEHGEPRIAVPQSFIRSHDVRNGDGPYASTKYPSDLVPEKPGTDVIVIGRAHPPAGKIVTSHEVRVAVAVDGKMLQKALRVFGTRVFLRSGGAPEPGPPQPLTVTPIIYENARGGVDRANLEAKGGYDHVNPSGRGTAVDPDTLVGTAAWSLECVAGRAPAGFGVIDAHWSPRRELAGTFDEHWVKTRSPVWPKDFDAHHFTCAHPDLHSDVPLTGLEAVEVIGMTPEQEWRFALPSYRPLFSAVLDAETLELETHLDTFLIDLDDVADRRVELCWRASVRLPRKTARLQRLMVKSAVAMPDDLVAALYEDLDRAEAEERKHNEISLLNRGTQ